MVVIAVLLLFFIALMFVISSPKPTTKTQASVNSSSSTEINRQLPQASNSSSSPSEYTYAGNNFQVTYPADLYTASGNKDNGEDNFLLQHKKSSPSGPGEYSIYFQIASSSGLPVQNILNIFDSFKYAKTTANLDGIQVVRYDGSINLANNSIHDSAIVFTKNNLTYKIQLTYQAAQEDTIIQNLFNQVLSGVKIY